MRKLLAILLILALALPVAAPAETKETITGEATSDVILNIATCTPVELAVVLTANPKEAYCSLPWKKPSRIF